MGFKTRSIGKNQVYGYIDSTYLSEEKSQCRYGVDFFVNGMSVFELSRRLPDIVLSSTEAEFVALSIGLCEGKYIRMLLIAMGEPQTEAMKIAQDNKSCIQIAENPGRHHSRTKHIDVRVRWVEQEIEAGRVELVYVHTDSMVADILTKALCYRKHAKFTEEMKGVKMPTIESKGSNKAQKRKHVGWSDMEMD